MSKTKQYWGERDLGNGQVAQVPRPILSIERAAEILGTTPEKVKEKRGLFNGPNNGLIYYDRRFQDIEAELKARRAAASAGTAPAQAAEPTRTDWPFIGYTDKPLKNGGVQ